MKLKVIASDNGNDLDAQTIVAQHNAGCSAIGADGAGQDGNPCSETDQASCEGHAGCRWDNGVPGLAAFTGIPDAVLPVSCNFDVDIDEDSCDFDDRDFEAWVATAVVDQENKAFDAAEGILRDMICGDNGNTPIFLDAMQAIVVDAYQWDSVHLPLGN